MSNVNSKAKPQTMDGKKLRKAEVEIVQLRQQLAQASMGILNMRQMYEGAVQTKLGLEAQLQRTNQMLVAAVSQSRGGKLVIKEATFVKLDKYAGLDTKVDDGALILSVLTNEQVAEMQADIEEMTSDE